MIGLRYIGLRVICQALLQKDAAEDDVGDREIDDEAGDVDEGGDKGSGGAGGIEAATAKNEREHGTGEGAEHDDADEAATDGEGDDAEVLTVGAAQIVPQQDAGDADHAEDRSKCDASEQLA